MLSSACLVESEICFDSEFSHGSHCSHQGRHALENDHSRERKKFKLSGPRDEFGRVLVQQSLRHSKHAISSSAQQQHRQAKLEKKATYVELTQKDS